jgi:hypothetical protein
MIADPVRSTPDGRFRRVYCPDLPANLGARVPNVSGPSRRSAPSVVHPAPTSHESP